MVFIFVTLIILLLLVLWCLFISKSSTMGRILYELNTTFRARLAKLSHVQIKFGDDVFSYYTNNRKDKPCMLLLHGFSADKTIWLPFAKYASRNFNLIIPDLMGHGDVPYCETQNYSAFKQADYVKCLLTNIGLHDSPLIIVGNSMGGMIGTILASAHSDANNVNKEVRSSLMINNLVLIDPAGAKSDFALQLKQANHNPFSHKTLNDSFAFYKLAMQAPPFLPLCVKVHVAQTNYLSKKAQYEHMFSDFFNPDEFFACPITLNAAKIRLIWGEEDKIIPVSEAKYWEKLLNCNTAIIPNIGHMPMVECPSLTYSLLH